MWGRQQLRQDWDAHALGRRSQDTFRDVGRNGPQTGKEAIFVGILLP